MTIVVTDTGIGIEPEIMERIFNRFEQGDHSFQRRYGGLGLGLTISKSLAEAHGGTLVAESDGRGRGARFSFRIKTVSARARRKPFTPSAKPSPRPLRFCLSTIIPTPALRGKMLTRRGHTVATTQDMHSALGSLNVTISISSSAMLACLMAVAWNS